MFNFIYNNFLIFLGNDPGPGYSHWKCSNGVVFFGHRFETPGSNSERQSFVTHKHYHGRPSAYCAHLDTVIIFSLLSFKNN